MFWASLITRIFHFASLFLLQPDTVILYSRDGNVSVCVMSQCGVITIKQYSFMENQMHPVLEVTWIGLRPHWEQVPPSGFPKTNRFHMSNVSKMDSQREIGTRVHLSLRLRRLPILRPPFFSFSSILLGPFLRFSSYLLLGYVIH